MNYGMLWFDNDPTTELPKKIEQAASYYRKKYGKAPNICYVNPSMLSNENTKSKQIEIKSTPTIMPHHLWIGTASKKKD